MSAIHRIIASVKNALETVPAANGHAPAQHHTPVPRTTSAERAELVSSFGHELEAVGGKFLGTIAPRELAPRIAAYAAEIGARSVALGEASTADMKPVAATLERAGCSVVRPPAVKDEARADARAQIFAADLGISAAEWAIASTGTVAVVSAAARPNSLTLVPPASLILVSVDRIVMHMADMLATLAPEAVAATRMTLITGPSRTADIEKRIVLGIHGPKSLAVIVVWPQDD
jgi:L-lactate dehydrogenase complex protein LldG